MATSGHAAWDVGARGPDDALVRSQSCSCSSAPFACLALLAGSKGLQAAVLGHMMGVPDLQHVTGDGLPLLDHTASQLWGDAACNPGLQTLDPKAQPASSQPQTPLPSQLTKVLYILVLC